MTYMKPLSFSLLLIVFFSCATTAPIEQIEPEPEKSTYEIFIENAQAGDVGAQVQIGISYQEGQGVVIDYDEAYKWFKLASSKGNNEAYYRIGTFYENGYSVEEDWVKTLEWYLSSAATGYNPAVGKLIRYYENNSEEQRRWIDKGVANDDLYSFYRYALILEDTNKPESLVYFNKVQELEDIDVQGILASLSLSNQLDLFSNDDAINKIKDSTEKGNARLQVFLGWLYEFGIWVERDVGRAFSLYEKAAKNFNILAIYNLSRFYGEGIHVEVDPHLSNQFFKQIPMDFISPVIYDLMKLAEYINAVDQQIVLNRLEAAFGNVDAFYQLGLLSEPSESYQWFWMAAEAGHNYAMIELAKLLVNGFSVDPDPVSGAAWLMVAENKLGIVDDSFNSEQIMKELSDSQKLEVSRLFTEIFYRDPYMST